MFRGRTLALATLLASFAACDRAGDGGSDPKATTIGGGVAGTDALIGALTITTIGSTVDPTNGDRNPFGLAIAPTTLGSLTRGDLLVSNFNDSANGLGKGTTLELLHPTRGSTPTRFAQSESLKGCTALAIGPDDVTWVAAYEANLSPLLTPTGTLTATLAGGPWAGPWNEVFAPAVGAAAASFITSNADDGSLVRTEASGHGFTTVAVGLALSDPAVPGKLAPEALVYDAGRDTLYVVDTNQNRVVALARFGALGAYAVTFNSDGTFGGPSRASASVLFSGAPLDTPLGAAELFNGDLVVGNGADNLLLEISPEGALVATQSLDPGGPGALFGIAVSGTSAATTQIYFVDRNDDTVKVASR